MSREQYVDYAISKGLRIDDNQLRMPTRMRAATSLAEYDGMRAGMTAKDVRNNPELKRIDTEFSKFAENMKSQAGHELESGIGVRSGTKDSNNWIFWKVNNGATAKAERVDKAYLGFDNPFQSLTPSRMKGFLQALKNAGYNGDVKTVQDLTQATHMSDQIVIHGASKADADLGMRIGKEFFKKDLTFSEMGYDSATQSYSQILDSRIGKALD